MKYLIPNLIGGVSQQEPSLRGVTQVEAVNNMVASPVYGLCDRPPTTIVKNITDDIPYSPEILAVSLFRSVEYKGILYHLVILPVPHNFLLVFDRLGQLLSKTSMPPYLQTSDPSTHLEIVEMSEAVMVINKTVPVKVSPPSGAYNQTPKRYIYVKGVVASGMYQVTGTDAGGTEYGPISVLADAVPDASSLGKVAASIAAAINNSESAWYNKWLATVVTGVTGLVEIQRITSRFDTSNITSENDTLTVSDSTGGALITAINHSISSVADLPPRLAAGMKQAVGIRGVGTKIAYYMGWTNVKDGWVETTADGGTLQIEPKTFPHMLRPDKTTDIIASITVTARQVGDANTSPLASFINSTIQDVALFQNRIAILTSHSVSLSTPHAFTTNKGLTLPAPVLDFSSDTATAVMDDDPIDIQTGDADLHHMAPLDTRLLLIGSKCAKSIGYNAFLSPKDVHLEHHLDTPSSRACNPLDVEGAILFAHSQTATQIKELISVPDTTKLTIGHRTPHLPTYLPVGVSRLVGYSPASTIFALSHTHPQRLYVCAYLADSQKKTVQNAWGAWEFGGTIHEMKVQNEVLTLIMGYSHGVEILSLDLTALDGEQLLLDRKTTFPAGSPAVSFDAATERTIIHVRGPVEVVVQDKTELPFVSVPDGVSVAGDRRGESLTTGVRYTRGFTLSPQIPRDQEGLPLVATRPMRFMLTRLEFSHYDGHHFTVKVTSPGGERITIFGPPLDQSLDIVNRAALSSRGRVSMTLMGDAVRTMISVENATIHPCKFTEAEIEGRISRL